MKQTSSNEKKYVGIRLSPVIADLFAKYTKQEGFTKSGFVEKLLKQEFKKRGILDS